MIFLILLYKMCRNDQLSSGYQRDQLCHIVNDNNFLFNPRAQVLTDVETYILYLILVLYILVILTEYLSAEWRKQCESTLIFIFR